jgi:hypothetical protein
MKRIETMKCRYPILFWIGWVSIAAWMVLAIINYAFDYTLLRQSDLDSYGFFLLIFGMFVMFRSLDWSEVEYFFFVKHPGRLRKIGYDYVLMFVVIAMSYEIQIELLRNILVMTSLAIYLYDMLRLVGFRSTKCRTY